MQASKHYIVHHEAIQGGKDPNVDKRRKTRMGRSSHLQIALGCKTALNSNKLHIVDNSKTVFETGKTKAGLSKETEIQIKSKDIYPQQCFCEKYDYAGWNCDRRLGG